MYYTLLGIYHRNPNIATPQILMKSIEFPYSKYITDEPFYLWKKSISALWFFLFKKVFFSVFFLVRGADYSWFTLKIDYIYIQSIQMLSTQITHTHTHTHRGLNKFRKNSMRGVQFTNMKNKVRKLFEGVLYLLNSSH